MIQAVSPRHHSTEPVPKLDNQKVGIDIPVELDTLSNLDRLVPILSRTPIMGHEPILNVDSTKINYTDAHLPTLDDFSHAAWAALHDFRAVATDYAGHTFSKSPLNLIQRAFNWSRIALPEDLSGSLHGVAFHSKRAPGSEGTSLYRADRIAHEEAVASGGLLMYWFGVPDADGMNLATCLWTDRESSRRASALPKHREAAALARSAYEKFELFSYKVEKRAGETGVIVT